MATGICRESHTNVPAFDPELDKQLRNPSSSLSDEGRHHDSTSVNEKK
jgi:hypothetical protein